jgi:hypothetical protein
MEMAKCKLSNEIRKVKYIEMIKKETYTIWNCVVHCIELCGTLHGIVWYTAWNCEERGIRK